MSKKSPFLSTCEHAAERIQYWFGRGKETIFHHFFKKIASHNLFQTHKCDMVKIPRVPSQVEHLPLFGYELLQDKKKKRRLESVKKRKIDLSALQKEVSSRFDRAALHTHCCVNQKNPYLLEDITGISSGFKAERSIKNWQLKEHFLAFRRFKSLRKQRPVGPRKHEIVPLTPSKKSTLHPDDQEYWKEMIRTKEHRLFQIGRITKYLVD